MPGNIGKASNARAKLAGIRNDFNAQTDPLRNPDGVYAGSTKRVAIQDGKFTDVQNMPKGDTTLHLGRRKKG